MVFVINGKRVEFIIDYTVVINRKLLDILVIVYAKYFQMIYLRQDFEHQ